LLLELVADSAQPTFPTHGPFLLLTGKPPPSAHYAALANFHCKARNTSRPMLVSRVTLLRWENGNEMMFFIMYANADACKVYVFTFVIFDFFRELQTYN
jgi:hypothetical protein